MVFAISCIEVTVLLSGSEIITLSLHFSLYLTLDFALHSCGFTTNLSNSLSAMLCNTVFCVVRIEELLVCLSIYPISSVIEHLALNRVLKVVVPFGDVRPRHSPIIYITDRQ